MKKTTPTCERCRTVVEYLQIFLGVALLIGFTSLVYYAGYDSAKRDGDYDAWARGYDSAKKLYADECCEGTTNGQRVTSCRFVGK